QCDHEAAWRERCGDHVGQQFDPGDGEGWINGTHGIAQAAGQTRRGGIGASDEGCEWKRKGLLEERVVILAFYDIPGEIGILGMAHHADDGRPGLVRTVPHMLAYWIFIGPVLTGEGLVNERDYRGVGAILIRERAPAFQRNLHGGEV